MKALAGAVRSKWRAAQELVIDVTWFFFKIRWNTAKLQARGMHLCDGCGRWMFDVRACVREVNMGDSGTGWAFHDVPVAAGDLCPECRVEDRATPEDEF